MADRKYVTTILIITVVNVFAASINIHDYYCWKTNGGKYDLPFRNFNYKIICHTSNGIAKYAIEPTEPNPDLIRLVSYDTEKAIYISPDIIVAIVQLPAETSTITGNTYFGRTRIDTIHGNQYLVKESAAYILRKAERISDYKPKVMYACNND